MNARNLPSPARQPPYVMLGAGRLVSTLQKRGDRRSGWRYRFNLFRLGSGGRVGQWLAPRDLIDLMQLTRVLAAELLADGCLTERDQEELVELAARLEQTFRSRD